MKKTEDMMDFDHAYSKLCFASAYEDECDLTIVEVRAIVDRIRTLEYKKRELEEKLKRLKQQTKTDEDGASIKYPVTVYY